MLPRSKKSFSPWTTSIAGLAVLLAVLFSGKDKAGSDAQESAPSPAAERKTFLNWDRVRNTLQFLATLLAISSFITALKFFQDQTIVEVKVHEPVAVTDLAQFAKEAPEATRQMLPCIHQAIPRTMLGQEYQVRVTSGTPTLMNPPFLLQGEQFVFVYHLGSSSPTFKPIFSTAPARGAVTQQENHDPEGPFSEGAMLKNARYTAGYGPYEPDRHRKSSLDSALSDPGKLRQLLQQRYGIEMVEATLPKRAVYLVEDIFSGCIDGIASSPIKRSAYYGFSKSRELWNPIELKNPSGNTVHDVILTIDRPWEGRAELVTEMVNPQGGEILHQSTFFNVVRFPSFLANSSKLLIMKTGGRALDDSALQVSHAKTSAPSLKLIAILAALSLLLSVIYFASARAV